MEASCHELTRLSGLLRQHSRKRKSEQNPEDSGPEWKRKSPNGNDGDEDDFREGGEPASMEKTARINVSERVQLHTLSTFLPHTIIPKRNSHDH